MAMNIGKEMNQIGKEGNAMKTLKSLIAALMVAALTGTGASAGTTGKIMDIVDFLVDRDSLVGQTVTVTGCTLASANSMFVVCNEGWDNIAIDSKTLAREDLRRAMHECAGIGDPAIDRPPNSDRCHADVTGTVTAHQTATRIATPAKWGCIVGRPGMLKSPAMLR
jgi:hypothetical protein